MAIITDLRHYLTDDGTIPENIPTPARKMALFLAAIASWVTSHAADQYVRTNVPCRRRPGRRPCAGIIEAWLAYDGATIVWQCPICGENGTIRGWEDTMWDRLLG